MKKNLTISIAAYNVEKYLDKTLKSLIVDRNDLEVLIVNDGSKDKTLSIAKKYEKKYPNIFKVIDKENGGYGSTINAGIKNATGKYFKQLDGDDWYDNANLVKLLDDLADCDADVIYNQYIQFFEGTSETKLIENSIEKSIDTDSLEEAIANTDNLAMHSLAYKTKILKDNKIKIDEHCFYTDTEYVLFPLLCSKTIKILCYPVYIYRLGLSEQSVSVKGKLKHYMDHVKADNTILDYSNKIKNLTKNLNEFRLNYMSRLFATCIGEYLLLLKSTKNNFKYIQEYDMNVKNKDIEVYNMMNNYSKAIKVIRKNNYLLYKLLILYRIILRKNK